MGRWTQYDEDSYRLPEGMTRVAYDADTRRYTFRDEQGKLYQSSPGNEYGNLMPVDSTLRDRVTESRFSSTLPREIPRRSLSVDTRSLPRTFQDMLSPQLITSASNSHGEASPTLISPRSRFINAVRRTALPKMQGVVYNLRRSVATSRAAQDPGNDESAHLMRKDSIASESFSDEKFPLSEKPSRKDETPMRGHSTASEKFSDEKMPHAARHHRKNESALPMQERSEKKISLAAKPTRHDEGASPTRNDSKKLLEEKISHTTRAARSEESPLPTRRDTTPSEKLKDVSSRSMRESSEKRISREAKPNQNDNNTHLMRETASASEKVPDKKISRATEDTRKDEETHSTRKDTIGLEKLTEETISRSAKSARNDERAFPTRKDTVALEKASDETTSRATKSTRSEERNRHTRKDTVALEKVSDEKTSSSSKPTRTDEEARLRRKDMVALEKLSDKKISRPVNQTRTKESIRPTREVPTALEKLSDIKVPNAPKDNREDESVHPERRDTSKSTSTARSSRYANPIPA